MNRRMNGVHVNEVQGNPFQPDVNYRGYTASPLLGTPQGLSVYMDGVRLNQPFGEIVSWDLIPRLAIATTTLMPGSNPLFGLNTLGGAILAANEGRPSPSRAPPCRRSYGSDLRRASNFEHGGHSGASRLHWYVAGNLFDEDGWRDDSPSDVRQVFGKLGWRARGPATCRCRARPCRQLAHGQWPAGVRSCSSATTSSVYTKPDITDNRSTFLNVTAPRRIERAASLRATPTIATSARRRSTATSTKTRWISRSISRRRPSARRSPRPDIRRAQPAG